MDTSTLFNQFNSQDSLAILFFMLIAFLFGLLVGYLLRSTKVRALKRELKDKKKELSDAQAKIGALQDELALKDADIKRASFAVQEAEAKAERIEQEKAVLHKQVFQLNADLDQQRLATNTFETEVISLRQELDDLKNQNTKLSATITTDDNATDELAQLQSTHNATNARIASLEKRLDQLAAENVSLKDAVEDLQANETNQPAQIISPPPSKPKVVLPHDEMASSVHPMPGLPDASVIEDEPEQIFTQDKSVLSEKLVDDSIEKDDLTLIEGIGPFLEKKLNGIGVYTYEEISTWDSNRIKVVTNTIGHFKGRIEKDRWVEQAAALALKKQEEPEVFTTPSQDAWTTDTEDLKIIEGIGPKIEGLLKEAGIVNWDELADASIDLLKSVLDNAGPRFRMHDPETWPTQAQLAIRGEWKLLKEYQDELIGGRDLSS